MTDHTRCRLHFVEAKGTTVFEQCKEGPKRHGCKGCCFGCPVRKARIVKGAVGDHQYPGCKKACHGPEI